MLNRSALTLVRKLFQLPQRDRRILLEASLWLAVAGLAIAFLPFRRVGRLAGCPISRLEPPAEARLTEIKRVRRAVDIAARRVPWRAVCFQRGLAAQFMLRRRGIPSVLYYGAAQEDRTGLGAHVWVRDGDVDVIGCEHAYRFAVLATFPPQKPKVIERVGMSFGVSSRTADWPGGNGSRSNRTDLHKLSTVDAGRARPPS